MATIEDVAAHAGVSIATVSRVLNNTYGVSQSKRDKVEEAVKALNYQPNVLGRNLRRSEPKMILVVCTEVINEAMSGIQDVASELGYDVILSYAGKNREGVDSIKFLQSGMVEGAIFLNLIFKEEELITLSNRLPVVQCGEYVDIPSSYLVACNDEKAAYELTCHLIQTGRRRIGFVAYETSGTDPHFSQDREKGYRRALLEHGIAYDASLRMAGDFSYDSGLEAARQFLAMENRPDAVVCTQDNMAAGCISAFRKAGIAVPEDIAVTGFDNTDIAEICDPQITTIAQPFYEIGRETMRLMVALIKGEVTLGRQVFINHQLLIRGSTVKDA